MFDGLPRFSKMFVCGLLPQISVSNKSSSSLQRSTWCVTWLPPSTPSFFFFFLKYHMVVVFWTQFDGSLVPKGCSGLMNPHSDLLSALVWGTIRLQQVPLAASHFPEKTAVLAAECFFPPPPPPPSTSSSSSSLPSSLPLLGHAGALILPPPPPLWRARLSLS